MNSFTFRPARHRPRVKLKGGNLSGVILVTLPNHFGKTCHVVLFADGDKGVYPGENLEWVS